MSDLPNFANQYPDDEEIDIRRILNIAADKWYLFAIFIFLGILVSYAFVWYSQPTYVMQATVLAEDEGNDISQNILDEVGFLSKKRNIENEIALLSSRSYMEQAMRKLDLGISYQVDMGLRKRVLYQNNPIALDYKASYAAPSSFVIHVEVSEDGNSASLDYEVPTPSGDIVEFSESVALEESFENRLGKFKIRKAESFDKFTSGDSAVSKSFTLTYRDVDALASTYMDALNVAEARDGASILRIKLEDEVPSRGVDIINMLLEVYIENNIEKKNQLAANSLKFIDRQLDQITADLGELEEGIKSFKTTSGVSDVSSEAEFFLTQVAGLDQTISKIDVQLSIINYLEEYINSDKDLLNASPSSLGIEDPLLQELIVKLSELAAERANSLRFTKVDNPVVNSIDIQISETKESLRKNIASIRSGLLASKSEVQTQLDAVESKVKGLPKAEYELLALQRQYSIKESLYLLLLEKKSENAIVLASTVSDNTIIDNARSSDEPIAPKKMLVYLMGLALGGGLPVIYVLLVSIFDSRIKDIEELKRATNIPFLGIIPHHNEEGYIVVGSNVNSPVAEAFRSIRTNLSFIVGQEHDSNASTKIIQLTSAMGSEGKSFSSINLAASMALGGSKTIVVGLDLRKPKLAEYFNLSNDTGVSSVLAGLSVLNDTICKTQVKNMDVLVAGPVPPNPAELLMSSKLKDILSELSEEYDYVILDTPPIGLVTDSLIIAEHAITTIYVVRQNVTSFHSLRYINDIYQSGKIKSISVILNDVKASRFGYGYGYGYGYGSYHQEKPKSIFDRVLSPFKRS
ncbi:MAG: polysaccharide biosynthesis tyrosine autokinase [Flavobacteriales bacterium]|nr:polysaccharide biosynthesis tyrosine autokinase [Flavobacteriales bacterium]